jgi:hypothetical protein
MTLHRIRPRTMILSAWRGRLIIPTAIVTIPTAGRIRAA